jgi:PAS domain S-box-containing protein
MDAIGVSTRGAILYCNQAFARLFGFDREAEVVGRPIEALIAPSEQQAIAARNRRRESGEGVPTVYETRGLRQDATEFPMEAHISTYQQGGQAHTVAILRDITEKKRAEEDLQSRYDKERNIAEALQRTLLREPPEDAFPGLTIVPIYDAALDEALVGGDFFDVVGLPGGQVALVVGDVSGKGLAAATHTAEVKYALRAFLREETDPASALRRVNPLVCDMNAVTGTGVLLETFVTLSLAVVDPASGRVALAVAGAEAPLILRADGTAETVDTGALPLGIEPGEIYPLEQRVLAPGDTLLLVTDGLIEARRAGAILGYPGLVRLVRAAHASSLRERGQAILDGSRAFAGGARQDDVCLLLARRL